MQLADGCFVPICTPCQSMIQEGRELASSRGHHKPDAIFKSRGGESVKIEKGNTGGGNNIKAKDMEAMRVTQLTIVDEGEMVTFTPKRKEGDKEDPKPTTKLIIGVTYKGIRDGDPTRWALNNKSRNALIDLWGDDTEKWIGKTADITYAGESEYRHIIVDDIRTQR